MSVVCVSHYISGASDRLSQFCMFVLWELLCMALWGKAWGLRLLWGLAEGLSPAVDCRGRCSFMFLLFHWLINFCCLFSIHFLCGISYQFASDSMAMDHPNPRQVLSEMSELIKWFQPERMVYTTLGNKDIQVYFLCLPGLEIGSSNLSYDGEDL